MNGAALVVGVPEFDGIKERLDGTISDVKMLDNALTSLGFDVTPMSANVTSSNFAAQLDKAVKSTIDNGKEYFVLAISTHGGEHRCKPDDDLENLIRFKDKVERTQSILDQLRRDGMKDVVKIILISACRSRAGPKEDYVDSGVDIEIVDGGEEGGAVSTSSPPSHSTSNMESCPLPELPPNCLIWFASPSGKYAYILNPTGSFFITSFCKEIRSIPPAGSKSFTDVVCGVHSYLASLENQNVELKEMGKPAVVVTWKNVPSVTHNLCRDFHFKSK